MKAQRQCLGKDEVHVGCELVDLFIGGYLED